MRGVSNWLDNKMGWEGERKEGSGTRAVIHGVYHSVIGVGKVCLNKEG
jgi:hypothetical protein